MSTQELGFWQSLWIKHLENGYTQTTSLLCEIEEDGVCCYCALGLAQEIAYANFSYQVAARYNNARSPRAVTYRDRSKSEEYAHYLTPFAAKLFEFRSTGQAEVARRNDRGDSFKKIAADVKANPETYFYEPA